MKIWRMASIWISTWAGGHSFTLNYHGNKLALNFKTLKYEI